MIICLCDGGCKGNPGLGTVGVVIWKRLSGTSSMRRVTPFHKISRRIGHTTNNLAEWQAILDAALWCKENAKQGEDIFIYSDSTLATHQANGKWKVKDNGMRTMYTKFMEVTHGFNVTISWLPRQLTCLADELT